MLGGLWLLSRLCFEAEVVALETKIEARNVRMRLYYRRRSATRGSEAVLTLEDLQDLKESVERRKKKSMRPKREGND
jgi:hypothetical protein